jgi:hypothetical protein
LPFDGVLVEASLQHEAMATAHGVRTFFVLLKQRRRVFVVLVRHWKEWKIDSKASLARR